MTCHPPFFFFFLQHAEKSLTDLLFLSLYQGSISPSLPPDIWLPLCERSRANARAGITLSPSISPAWMAPFYPPLIHLLILSLLSVLVANIMPVITLAPPLLFREGEGKEFFCCPLRKRRRRELFTLNLGISSLTPRLKEDDLFLSLPQFQGLFSFFLSSSFLS